MQTTPTLPRLGRGRLGQQAAELLEARILEGVWKPGELLPPQEELGSLLGVSRSVVRDALHTLAARGLVEIRQGVGTTVAHRMESVYGDAIFLSLLRGGATVGEVAEAREMIERVVATAAAVRRTEEDCERLAGHLARLEEAVAARRWRDALEAHLAFHLAILHATHMNVLELLLGPMQQIVLVSSLPPALDEPHYYEIDREREVLAAIVAGDERAADEAMRRHFAFVRDPAYAEMFTKPVRPGSRIDDLIGADGASAHPTSKGGR
jgi:GntR family transcriptional repressor for pyruvate dehydrogenase complex